MIRKISFYKRRIKGFLKIFLFSLLLFLGVFALCIGIWSIAKSKIRLESPLAKVLSAKSNVSTAIQMLCFTNHFNCTSITINSDRSATVTLESQEIIIISLQKDLAWQFSSLQLTNHHLTIEGKRLSRLDFRFDKPVISYK